MVAQPGGAGRTVSYRVSHSIPGRVRFHIPRIAADPQYVGKLTELVEADSSVSSMRVNLAAASVAIRYQAREIQEHEMQARLISLIQSARDLASSTNTPQMVGHSTWQRLALPAVSAALAVLGGLWGWLSPPLSSWVRSPPRCR